MHSSHRHQHAEGQSEEELAHLVRERAPAVRAAYLAVHRLVLETLPDVTYSTDLEDAVTGYGARQYGYDGWGLAALGAHGRWASLMFMRGADLADPAGLLEGTGKKMRHVKLRSPEEVEARRGALTELLASARGLIEH